MGCARLGEISESGQMVQIPSCKLNKFWGCNVQHVNTVNNAVGYLKFGKGDLKSSHYKKNNYNCVRGYILIKFIVIIICEYKHILYHCILYLKLIQCCMSIITA